MSSREFSEWIAFDKISPIGRERDDFLFALVAWTIAEANRSRKGKKYKISDFIPKWGRKGKEPQDWRVIKNKMDAFIGMFGSGK